MSRRMVVAGTILPNPATHSASLRVEAEINNEIKGWRLELPIDLSPQDLSVIRDFAIDEVFYQLTTDGKKERPWVTS